MNLFKQSAQDYREYKGFVSRGETNTIDSLADCKAITLTGSFLGLHSVTPNCTRCQRFGATKQHCWNVSAEPEINISIRSNTINKAKLLKVLPI